MIGEEYFRFNEAGRAFVGHAATYRLGDPVTVELVEAAPVAGALRFKLVRGEHARRRETQNWTQAAAAGAKRAPASDAQSDAVAASARTRDA